MSKPQNKTASRAKSPPQRRPAVMTPEEFKEARIALSLSQQALADLADTGRATINNMETGKSRVTGLWRLLLDLLKEREEIREILRETTPKSKGLEAKQKGGISK